MQAENMLIVRVCRSCGGTPTLLPGRHCYSCDSTGREFFYLSECLGWIDLEQNKVASAEFKARHGITDRDGIPRVQSRTI